MEKHTFFHGSYHFASMPRHTARKRSKRAVPIFLVELHSTYHCRFAPVTTISKTRGPAQRNKCSLGAIIFADEPLMKMIKNPCFFINTKDTWIFMKMMRNLRVLGVYEKTWIFDHFRNGFISKNDWPNTNPI